MNSTNSLFVMSPEASCHTNLGVPTQQKGQNVNGFLLQYMTYFEYLSFGLVEFFLKKSMYKQK
jgi:hypothetical protein